MSIENPNAWPVEVADGAGIGPAHRNHPYHSVYYGPDGQPLQDDVLAANMVEAEQRFPAFPALVRQAIVGAEEL